MKHHGPSPEVMDEVFRKMSAWGETGRRIVEIHKEIIARLDAIIEAQNRRRHHGTLKEARTASASHGMTRRTR